MWAREDLRLYDWASGAGRTRNWPDLFKHVIDWAELHLLPRDPAEPRG